MIKAAAFVLLPTPAEPLYWVGRSPSGSCNGCTWLWDISCHRLSPPLLPSEIQGILAVFLMFFFLWKEMIWTDLDQMWTSQNRKIWAPFPSQSDEPFAASPFAPSPTWVTYKIPTSVFNPIGLRLPLKFICQSCLKQQIPIVEAQNDLQRWIKNRIASLAHHPPFTALRRHHTKVPAIAATPPPWRNDVASCGMMVEYFTLISA